MKNKLATWRKSEGYKVLSGSYLGFLIGLVIAQLAFLFMTFATKKALTLIHALLGTLVILAFGLFKDEAPEGQKKFGKNLFLSSLFITVLALIDGLFLAGITKITLKTGNADLAKQMILFLGMLDFALLIGFIAALTTDASKEILSTLDEGSVWTMITGEEAEEIKPGDATLGRRIDMKFKENGDKVFEETDMPVVLPVKDRYLHMLILGPTGSGKTSQIIIPMINRDIQNPNIGIIAMEPKGDLAEKVYAMALHYGREVQYFNPILPDCPYFNPLFGIEEDVVENMATTFKMLDNDSSQFFQNMSENLIRNSLKVLKRLYGNDATMLDLYTLVHNNESKGKKIVQEFSQIQSATQELQKENDDIVSWFLGDYFTGSTGDARGGTKTYEHCSGVRSQIAKLVSNKYMRQVLNPPPGHGSDVDFDDALERGTVIAIATAQGKLRDLGRFLGYFLILQLQSSVFKRPGNEDTRRGCMLYIDEFQVYSNPGFADMLTQGRSYRVASHLATQARDQIGMGSGREGEAFIQLVSSNARNLIIFPGGNFKDASFYSDQFGELMLSTVQKGHSQQKAGLGNAFTYRPVNESIRKDESLTARFSASDIIYRPFGEITYLLIKNNTIQAPGVAKIEFIPKELNKKLDTMIANYNEIQDKKHQEKYEESFIHKPEAQTELVLNNTDHSDPTEKSNFKPLYSRDEILRDIDKNEALKKKPVRSDQEMDYSTSDGLDEEYEAPVRSSVIMDDDGEEEEWY